MRGSRFVGKTESVRALGADVAVLHCRGAVVTRGRQEPTRRRESVQTLVAARHGEGWQFTDFHDTRYRPLPKIATWFVRRAAARHSDA